MLREFAVEPDALSSWNNCRLVLDRFVMGSGAVLSEYPKRWKRMVYECASSQCHGIELTRIVESLKGLDRRITIPSRREFPDSGQDWIGKAVSAHQKIPFGGIVCAKDEHAVLGVGVIPVSEVGATHPLFVGLGQAHVTRDSLAMVEAVALLLREATHVKFVDAHYKPGGHTGFDGPIKALLEQIRVGGEQRITVELHTESSDRRPLEEILEEGFVRLVKEVMPIAEIVVVFYPHGSLHNRFLLTDRGGVMWGTGLDEQGASSNKTDSDDLFLLNEKLFELHWKKWIRSPG